MLQTRNESKGPSKGTNGGWTGSSKLHHSHSMIYLDELPTSPPHEDGPLVSLARNIQDYFYALYEDFVAFKFSNLACMKFTLLPDSGSRKIANLVLALSILLQCFLVPVRCVWGYHSWGSLGFWLAADYLMDFVYILDIWFHLVTAYTQEGTGKMITDRKTIMWRYLKKDFLLHFLASLPLDFLALSYGFEALAWCRLNRLLRVTQLSAIFTALEKGSGSAVIRISRLFFTMLLFAHWFGCIWFYIAKWEGLGEDTWAYHAGVSNQDIFTQYITSAYWALVVMTTVGFGDIVPLTNTEKCFTILTMITGVSIYATIFGNMATLIAQMDASATRYREKLDALHEYMTYRSLPQYLRKRILNYYDVIWSRHKGIDENSILNELPSSLRSEIALYLNRELVENVPLFKGTNEPGFINSLVVMLKPQVALAGDNIIRHGEIGREMYFLSRGEVEVVSGDGKTVFAKLKEGSYFGEIALLFAARRIATIRAVGYCELLLLTKEDFDSVLNFFPSFAETLRAIAKQKIDEERRKREAEAPQSNPPPPPNGTTGNSTTASNNTTGKGSDPKDVNERNNIRPGSSNELLHHSTGRSSSSRSDPEGHDSSRRGIRSFRDSEDPPDSTVRSTGRSIARTRSSKVSEGSADGVDGKRKSLKDVKQSPVLSSTSDTASKEKKKTKKASADTGTKEILNSKKEKDEKPSSKETSDTGSLDGPRLKQDDVSSECEIIISAIQEIPDEPSGDPNQSQTELMENFSASPASKYLVSSDLPTISPGRAAQQKAGLVRGLPDLSRAISPRKPLEKKGDTHSGSPSRLHAGNNSKTERVSPRPSKSTRPSEERQQETLASQKPIEAPQNITATQESSHENAHNTHNPIVATKESVSMVSELTHATPGHSPAVLPLCIDIHDTSPDKETLKPVNGSHPTSDSLSLVGVGSGSSLTQSPSLVSLAQISAEAEIDDIRSSDESVRNFDRVMNHISRTSSGGAGTISSSTSNGTHNPMASLGSMPASMVGSFSEAISPGGARRGRGSIIPPSVSEAELPLPSTPTLSGPRDNRENRPNLLRLMSVTYDDENVFPIASDADVLPTFAEEQNTPPSSRSSASVSSQRALLS